MIVKSAMIFAAGFGTRLKPITDKLPKPLIKVYNKTLLQYAIDALLSLGIENIVINAHYKSDQIIKYVNLKCKSLPVRVVSERVLLDTGGGIKNAIKYFNEDYILTINSDVLWNKKTFSDLDFLIKNFNKKNNFTLLLTELDKMYGIKKNIGDFKMINDLVFRNTKINEGYIYSGAQIMELSKLNIFRKKVFSLNEVWDYYINKKTISGIIMKEKLLHLGNLKSFDYIKDFKP